MKTYDICLLPACTEVEAVAVKYPKVEYTPIKRGVLNFGTSRYKHKSFVVHGKQALNPAISSRALLRVYLFRLRLDTVLSGRCFISNVANTALWSDSS
jgi:hypothetical protein